MYADATRLSLTPAVVEALRKPAQGHKYSSGHALVLGGGAAQTGAARLAARAALRVGAGVVTLGVPQAALAECAAQLTAIMLRQIASAAEIREALEDDRISALCLGPGFGVARAQEVLPAVLATRRPCVLDADALTALGALGEAGGGQSGGLAALLHGDCILTPHAGEFKRICPQIAARLAQDDSLATRIAAVRAASADLGCVVLLKGAQTVIATPDGACSLSDATGESAVPWLATAGAGDVLAGLITGLRARGFAPRQAAETGALLHVAAARSFGAGLIAEDLPETLPQVLRALGV
ncbi:Bifunctional NAD(P)H-hydrate repair enzyme Nnr [Aquimixticola soesokkakensis]|uniref:ADP-dependent (S)-NAD(P)H-hydrate dehydratase n=1 Tax=Aquimixticola soesokkakensis TaxID=1519096 RepID=A0A1Y5SPY9_9RHOB|nr:NAD(P)H-hydrate dehydratase [Aquimixticola soesokkakensis]SLN45574.1 Bifunctional NAD(P)H-hydrate repair enzyme Nnr [Aquimixticola soesokkakensis]